MFYRRKTYQMDPAQLQPMNDFFHEYVLPVQLKHGARLVGRWVTEDKTEIVAIWEYDSREQFLDCEAQVALDPDQRRAEQIRKQYGPLFLASREEFLEATSC